MKNVLIVGTQGWNQLKPEDYASLITTIKNALEDEVQVGSHKQPAAEVELVPTPEEARAQLRSGKRIDVVVFVSRGEQADAEQLALQYPHTRMIVLTGLIPDGLVVWVGKHWIRSSEDIRLHILD